MHILFVLTLPIVCQVKELENTCDFRRSAEYGLLLFLDKYPLCFLLHPTADIAHCPHLSWGMRRNYHRLPFQLGFAHGAASRALHLLNC